PATPSTRRWCCRYVQALERGIRRGWLLRGLPLVIVRLDGSYVLVFHDAGEPVEGFAPALPSGLLVGVRRRSDGAGQRGRRLAVALVERHRPRGFPGKARAHPIVRRLDQVAFRIGEAIGVDQPLRRGDLAVHASAPEVLALGRSHAVVPDATR